MLKNRFKLLLILLCGFFCPATANAQETLHGINATGWFTWPRFNSFDGPGVYWPPFPPNRHMPELGDFQTIRALGFNTIRIGVDPALFMGLSGQHLDIVERQILESVKEAQDSNLVVIFDLHPNSKHKIYGQSAFKVLDGGTVETDYIAAIKEVARMLAPLPSDKILLEVMNEPRIKCVGEDEISWQSFLRRVVLEVRQIGPGLRLMLSGSSFSRSSSILMKPISKLALWITSGASPMKSRKSLATALNVGLSFRNAVFKP